MVGVAAQGAGAQANDVGHVALRQQAFWRNIQIGGISKPIMGPSPKRIDPVCRLRCPFKLGEVLQKIFVFPSEVIVFAIFVSLNFLMGCRASDRH